MLIESGMDCSARQSQVKSFILPCSETLPDELIGVEELVFYMYQSELRTLFRPPGTQSGMEGKRSRLSFPLQARMAISVLRSKALIPRRRQPELDRKNTHIIISNRTNVH